MSLQEFLGEVCSLRDTGYCSETIEPLLRGLRLDAEALAPYCAFSGDCYTRNIAHRDDAIECVVLCWPAGASTKIHDHGGQHGWFVVVQGALWVQEYEYLAEGVACRRGEPYRLRANDGKVGRECNEIHRVWTDPDAGPAISLNLYARPILQFATYREAVPR